MKIHPCGSDVISELKHRSLSGRNETRNVNLEEQSARAQSDRTENLVGDTAGSVSMFGHVGGLLHGSSRLPCNTLPLSIDTIQSVV